MPLTKSVVVNVGWPPIGAAEHPTGEVDALAPGVGVLMLSLPPQAESRPIRSAAPAQRAARRWGVSGGELTATEAGSEFPP
jgi:hypothetical protein